jgi:non-heme chloroperoxidase
VTAPKGQSWADRYAYFEGFFNNFCKVGRQASSRTSDQAWQAAFIAATHASPRECTCVGIWLTGFRTDLPTIDVPVMVVHGTEGRVPAFDAMTPRGGRPPWSRKCVDCGPHNIAWTHPDESTTSCRPSSANSQERTVPCLITLIRLSRVRTASST